MTRIHTSPSVLYCSLQHFLVELTTQLKIPLTLLQFGNLIFEQSDVAIIMYSESGRV